MLFVLTDGAPVDDSTLSVNPGNFLEKHLMAATGWIEQEKSIELYGIGIHHDAKFYTNAKSADYEDVGVPVLNMVFKGEF